MRADSVLQRDVDLISESSFVVRRRLKAPADAVFHAWTDREFAMRWSWGRDYVTMSCSIDLRIGGLWTHHIRNTQNDEQWYFDGEFTEVVPGERIAHSFHWKSDGGVEHPVSFVTIEFIAHGEETEVVITHERLTSVTERDGTVTGWNDCIDCVALCLEDAIRARRSTSRTLSQP